MSYDELETGLKARGFIGIEGINGMGNCHKNEQHYILTTDGLVIYSSIPYYNSVKHFPEELEVCWTMEKWWNENDPLTMAFCLRPDDKIFSFEELDIAMQLVDEQRKHEK